MHSKKDCFRERQCQAESWEDSMKGLLVWRRLRSAISSHEDVNLTCQSRRSVLLWCTPSRRMARLPSWPTSLDVGSLLAFGNLCRVAYRLGRVLWTTTASWICRQVMGRGGFAPSIIDKFYGAITSARGLLESRAISANATLYRRRMAPSFSRRSP